jgi:pyruvate formate lyase activating enzyme
MTNNEPKSGGIIFNIQRYSIHDGPGIRTTVFLKGCPLSCFWCQNPESQHKKPELFFQKDRCTACGACIPVCPNTANTLLDGIIFIDRDKCQGCGKCVEACPSTVRTLMGRYATVDEIMNEILRDKRFYKKSGGGITLSGGEPTAQADFALALLEKCKSAGLHTAIETCGYSPWPTVERFMEFTDLFLFDIKCMNPERHRESVGRSNDLILENAARIAKSKPIRIRVPVIPGFNDNPDEILAIARFAKDNLGNCAVDLLPYNRMGESKYDRLSRPLVCLESLGEERFAYFGQIVADCLQD